MDKPDVVVCKSVWLFHCEFEAKTFTGTSFTVINNHFIKIKVNVTETALRKLNNAGCIIIITYQ